ncbi:NAD(P)-dependent oxidoreductase [Paraburkholderia sp. HD33-4]|uniref:NAD(P)-dependent oxidoreductase n=1 Tax=Paraburkholderia sp. HD33-4 TaxID=2883242 RepID=UPI001F2E015A|nr:NAD(P)-dependent oxidoreductase [Paraburkholderia sp. HD33-4]
MNVGYVGLGSMGGALARRLLLTHPLVVYDRSPDAVRNLVSLGAVACESPGEVAARCDVVFLCLPTSAHVREVLFGPDGIVQGAGRNTVVVDQTTGDPGETRRMGAELANRGITLIDAPVTGGIKGAEAGTISIMVGAATEVFEAYLPILHAISTNVFHAGGLGAGHVIKLVNNLLSGSQRLLTMEAVALAAKNGIDPEAACKILMSGGANNAFLEKFMAPHVIKGNVSPGFTLGLMHKDVRLACQMASESGMPMFFGSSAREFYQMCINELGANAQVHAAALVFDRIAGTHVVPVQASN